MKIKYDFYIKGEPFLNDVKSKYKAEIGTQILFYDENENGDWLEFDSIVENYQYRIQEDVLTVVCEVQVNDSHIDWLYEKCREYGRNR